MLVLGIEAAASTKQLTSYWSLQRRHDDRHRWVDVARFVTRTEGEDAHARLAAAAPDVDLAARPRPQRALRSLDLGAGLAPSLGARARRRRRAG